MYLVAHPQETKIPFEDSVKQDVLLLCTSFYAQRETQINK
jgi:hypothetical protein